MEIKPMETGEDYRAALQEIETLMTAEPGTPAGERLDVLVTLVEAYERRHFPLTALTAVEYLEERAKRGSREKFEAALARLPDVVPEDYDKL